MSIKRPVDNKVAAHFFSKEGAIHADDKKYLLSSKGNDAVRLPLAKGCGNFNGVDNRIDFNDFSLDGAFTISFWVKGGEGNSAGGRHDANNVIIRLDSSTLFRFFTGTYYSYNLALPFNFNVWNHVLYTRASKTDPLFLYINGVLEADSHIVVTASTTIFNSWGTFDGSSTIALLGKLYDCRVYSTLVSQQEVDKIINFNLLGNEVGQWALEEKAGNTAYDSTPNGNHGTINGDLTNFWYEGVDVPWNFANEKGYSELELIKYQDLLDANLFDPPQNDIAILNGLNNVVLTAEVNGLFRTGTYKGKDSVAAYYPVNDTSAKRIDYNNNTLTVTEGETYLISFDYYQENNIFYNIGQIYFDGASPANNEFKDNRVYAQWARYEQYITITTTGTPILRILLAVGKLGSGDFNLIDEQFFITNYNIQLVGNIPAINPTTDALGNALTNVGAVRHRAKVNDVYVGSFDGSSYVTAGKVTLLSSATQDFEVTMRYEVFAVANSRRFIALNTQSEGLTGASGLVINHFNANTTVFFAGTSDTYVYRQLADEVINLHFIKVGTTYSLYFGDELIGTKTDAAIGNIDWSGTLTNIGALTDHFDGVKQINDVRVNLLDAQGIFVSNAAHWTFNEGQGDTVYDLIGDNNGTWLGHTDPNQWGKSDDAIDYNLIDTKLRAGTDSKIDFNPYLALGEGVPTAYEAEGLVPADAFMYMNQTFIPSPTFGTEADAAITNMEIKTPYERQFVAEFVEELLDIGAYALIDEQMLLGLRHDAGLKMMKGSAVPVNNGAVYVEGIGYEFFGAEYIDMAWIPNVDASNFADFNRLIGAWVSQKSTADNSIFMGTANSSSSVDRTDLAQSPSTPRTLMQFSDRNRQDSNISDALYIGAQDATTTKIFTNGVEISSTTAVSYTLRGQSFYLGARNQAGSPNSYWTGIIKNAVIGAAINFPHLDYYNALTTVQTKIELGNQIKDILIYNSELKTADDVRRLYAYINEPVGRLDGLVDYEATAIDRLIRNERSIGD